MPRWPSAPPPGQTTVPDPTTPHQRTAITTRDSNASPRQGRSSAYRQSPRPPLSGVTGCLVRCLLIGTGDMDFSRG